MVLRRPALDFNRPLLCAGPRHCLTLCELSFDRVLGSSSARAVVERFSLPKLCFQQFW